MSGGLPGLGVASEHDLTTAQGRAMARIDATFWRCRQLHPYAPRTPCVGCLADMVVEYEEARDTAREWAAFNAAMAARMPKEQRA